MADGIARVAGAGLWLDDRAGQKYYLSGAIGAEAELEQYMLSQRKTVLDALLPEYERLINKLDVEGKPDLAARKLAEDMRKDALNELRKNANERRVPPEDQIAFIRSREGFIWMLWCRLQWGAGEKNLPPVSMEKATEIFELDQERARKAESQPKLPSLVDQVTGTDLRAGQTGPPAERRSTGGPKESPSPMSAATCTDIPAMANGGPSRGEESFETSRASTGGIPSRSSA